MRKPKINLGINLEDIFNLKPLDEVVQKHENSYFLMFYSPLSGVSIVYNVPEEYLKKSLGEFIDEVVKNTKSEKDYFWARGASREFYEPSGLVEFNGFSNTFLEDDEDNLRMRYVVWNGEPYYLKEDVDLISNLLDGIIVEIVEDVKSVNELKLNDIFSNVFAERVTIDRKYVKGKVAIVTCVRSFYCR
ncbi:MAG: hypothetical protein J7K22_00800 [Nanoarchaeota archaeon]|nr:hypothetical protein [Nanoarchaeota archaeon]